jgi:hypothetical protein
MHLSSHHKMAELLAKHDPTPAPAGRLCIDVGSLLVRHQRLTYSAMALEHCERYLGLDIVPGRNVGLVVPAAGGWRDCLPVTPAGRQLADITISGQCLEHVARPWEWIHHVCEITAGGGLIIIIAPCQCPQHRYPIDCWRILPDGMRALLEYAGLEVLEVGHDWGAGDCWGAARVFPM